MKNFRQIGKTISCTAPSGGVVSGGGYKIGDIFGVAKASAAEGDPFELTVEGVFTLPKASSGAINEGVKVYWHASNFNVTTTASGNTLIGHCVGGAADGATECDVRLSM